MKYKLYDVKVTYVDEFGDKFVVVNKDSWWRD